MSIRSYVTDIALSMNDPTSIRILGNGVIEIEGYVDDISTVAPLGEKIALACVSSEVESLPQSIIAKMMGKPVKHLVRQQWQIVP